MRWPRLLVWGLAFLGLAISPCILHLRLDLDASALIHQDTSIPAHPFNMGRVMTVVLERPGGILTQAGIAQVRSLSREIEAMPGVRQGSLVSLASVPLPSVKDATLQVTTLGAGGEDMRAAITRLGLDSPVFVNNDNRATAMYFQVRADASPAELVRRLEALAVDASAQGAALKWTGAPAIQHAIGEAALQDIKRLLPVMGAVFFMVLWLLLSSWRLALIPMLEMALAFTLTAGLLAVFGLPLHITSLILPAILVGVGGADDIQALSCLMRLPAASVPETDAAPVLVPFVRTVLLTVTTTLAGFVSFVPSPLLAQKSFGINGALAIAVSGFLTLTFVPAMYALFPAAERRPQRLRGGMLRGLVVWLRWLTSWASASPGKTVLSAASVLLVAVLLIGRLLQVDDNWRRNVPSDWQCVRMDEEIDQRFAGNTTLDVIIDTGAEDSHSHPDLLARLFHLQALLRTLPDVSEVQSDLSQLARFCSLMNNESHPAMQALLEGGDAGTLRSAAALAGLHGSVWDRASLLKPDASGRFLHYVLFMKNGSHAKIEALQRAVLLLTSETLPASCLAAFDGDGGRSQRAVAEIVHGQMLSLAIALVCDFLCLALALRSLRIACAGMGDVLLTVAATLALMALLRIPLGITTSLLAGVLAGIAADHNFHMLGHMASACGTPARVWAHAFPPMLVTCLGSGLSFTVLLLAKSRPNVEIGLMLAAGTLVSAVFIAVFLPSLAGPRRTRSSSP